MGKFLDWYAAHNTLIIQGLAVLIALLIIFFIFRLFFAAPIVDAVKSSPVEVSFEGLDIKLNKLLEQHAQVKAVAPTEAPRGESAEQALELEQLKAEITTLKESLSQKETELLKTKDQGAAANPADLSDLNQKLTDYENQIAKLNNRLSEYEIIAEDIADLQKFKTENENLKKQAEQAAASAAALKVAAIEATTEVKTEQQSTDSKGRGDSSASTEGPGVSPVLAADPAPTSAGPINDTKSNLDQNEISNLLSNFSEATPATANVNPDEVSADEIESLDDFEKSFQKG